LEKLHHACHETEMQASMITIHHVVKN